MTQDLDNNPLDDELLKELGLDPKEIPGVLRQAAAPQAAVSQTSAAQKTASMAAASSPARTTQPPVKGAPPKGASPVGAPPAPVSQKAPVVSEAVRFEQGIRHLAEDMPVQVVAVLGKRSMTLQELISLKQGEILELKKIPQDSIDLVANGKLVARGELVLVDGKLGIQIKQLV